MNKIIGLLLILLAAGIQANTQLAGTQANILKIGIAWAGKSGMTDRVAEGLAEVLAKEAPQIEIEWQRAVSGITELDKVAKRFQREKDAMVLLRSTGAKYLRDYPSKIPAFIGGCNNPVHIGVVKSLQYPGVNVTGVTYAIPYDIYFKTFLSILPNMKSIALVTEAGHPGSPIDQKGTRQQAEKLNIEYFQISVSSKEELALEVAKIKDKVSAIIIANQALIFDNPKIVLKSAGNTPVLAYTAKPVSEGVLGGLSANDVKLGRMLAESIISVLVNGTPIYKLAVKVDDNPKLIINIRKAEELGITIPLDVLSVAKIHR
jgi:putative ABC transport system substrate-binding protein